jgi:hypothetical protein
LYVWDLPTSTATRLAPYVDFIDGSVRISPDGNTVVLAYCPYCDVLQAHRSGGVWVTSPVTSTLTRVERNPDTDGDWVLYQVNFPPNYSSSHLFLRPVTGGPETTLAIPGNQADPSIDAGVITFDSAAALGGAGDIFVYVLATNTLYQVTNTPEESEVAGDVSVLPNGDIRVAWTAGVGRQVRAMTFTPSH